MKLALVYTIVGSKYTNDIP